MKLRSEINSLIFLIAATACSKAKPSQSPLAPAPSMDIGQMNGEWHVAARIPTIFDREATDMRMTFSVKQDYSMEIDWAFKKDPASNKESTYSFKGQAGNARQSTIWSISPIWPVTFTFQVLEFSGDYSWIAIGSPNRKYLWILAKSDNINPLLIDGLLNRMKKSEFDIAAVVKPVKENPRNSDASDYSR